MAAYLVADVNWNGTDPSVIQAFGAKAAVAFAAHGGRMVARALEPRSIEGDWHPPVLAIIEFDSEEALEGLLASSEFQEAVAIRRQTAADFKLVGVPGL